MTSVVIIEGERFDDLLKRFRKRITKDRILSEVKRRRYFVSKSEQRRRARRKAVVRERRRQSKAQRRYRG